MSAQHHHTIHPRKTRQFWLKEENILGTLAAFLAFAFIFAYTGGTNLYYPFVSALGMGAVIYTAVKLTAQRKL